MSKIRSPNTWFLDPEDILTESEIKTVLASLQKKKRRSRNQFQNLAIFRLSCCCGLRRSEISRLKMKDVAVTIPKTPYIRVAKGKGDKRFVPLWWDVGTWLDLGAWKRYRVERQGATDSDYYICTQRDDHAGFRLVDRKVRLRWKTATRCLTPERHEHLTTHNGRHSFITYALREGHPINEVRQAAGHKSLATTSIYAHVILRADESFGSMFDFMEFDEAMLKDIDLSEFEID